MLPLEDAQTAIAHAIRPAQETETASLDEAVGRYLAEAVIARVDHPAFDNSAMDGYALRLDEAAARDFCLPVRGEARAGATPAPLAPGVALRIYTGAPLPAGADTVVMQEDVEPLGDGVRLPRDMARGAHIRRRGEDYCAGETLYTPGRRVRALDIGLLAAAGIERLRVYRRARVLVVSTGDELVSPGQLLAPGQIYESNTRALCAQLRAFGAAVTDAGIVPDRPQALRSVLADAGAHDFVISSGGVSVGAHDVVKQVYAAMGSIDVWKVRLKPGKPFAFGRLGDATYVFALPGNPLSTLVTYKLFVEPALVRWHHGVPREWRLRAAAADAYRRAPGRTEFLRAQLYIEQERLMARVLPGQGSHQIGALRNTNGLIRLEATSEGFALGESVVVMPLDYFGDSP